MLKAIFSQFSCFGFSGSRSQPPTACAIASQFVPSDAAVFVGCAQGVDAFFRAAFPQAVVFSVASGDFGPTQRGAFAARSVACVRAVASQGGLWVSFPAAACPAGLLPSASSGRCFCGSGSGSWASLAFAVGSGAACLVFLGALPCPLGWQLSPVPGAAGWFSFSPMSAQTSLF